MTGRSYNKQVHSTRYHPPTHPPQSQQQLSHDRNLDGVLDKLNSSRLGPDGQSLDTINGDEEESEEEGGWEEALPGAKRGVDGSRRRVREEVRSSCVRFSPTGREWAAATPQGLLVYALEEDMIFNPLELDEAATPEAVERKIKEVGRFTHPPTHPPTHPLCLLMYAHWKRTHLNSPTHPPTHSNHREN